MFRYPYQIHECPVCGRPLEVRDEHRGRRITCPHCHGQFVARKPIDTVKTGAASKEDPVGQGGSIASDVGSPTLRRRTHGHSSRQVIVRRERL